ncbi:transposase [Bifidobacterium eulemuris]|nr:transposase [Bifidobacterium eulemuris]
MLSHAGAARFAFNAALAHVKDQLERGEAPDWNLYALRRWWNANKARLAPWWAENSKEAYNTGLSGLADALCNFTRSRKGQRKGRRVGFPTFRSRDRTTPRFAYTTGSFGLILDDPKALRLPRIGRVHTFENVMKRVGDGRVLRMTVSRRAGRWYASLTVERADPPASIPPEGAPIGVDLGVKELATISDGTVVHNPRPLERNLGRLAKAQRSLSRKKRGSNRYAKARVTVARTYARVANLRADAMHKLTTKLADGHSDVCIEDLNVQGMTRNHKLARAIEDAAFAEFRRMLTYKCARSGARLHVVDRFYPSSKTCSACGMVKAKLSLKERTYACEACGLTIDRDLNAAKNILDAVSATGSLNARGADVRPAGPRTGGRTAMKREPSVRASGVRLGAGVGNDAMHD